MHWILLCALLGLLLLMSLTLLLMMRMNQSQSQNHQNQLIQMNQNLQKQNQDLMNRLMSQDLQAYATMTALQNSSERSISETDTYYSMHDEAELARLQGMSAAQGLGEPLYVGDDEMSGLMQDFGISESGS